jgi:acetolactate synthase-1/2/3 large subunit
MMDALADGTPLVVFAGQVNSSMIGLDAFQEVDMLSMSRPCTKWNVRVRSPAELEGRIDEAFEIATARGRPGPVLVELPQDVTACRVSGDGGGGGGRPCGQEIYHLDRASPSPSTLSNPGSAARRRRQLIPAVMANEAEELRQALRETARLINVAKKPVLYVGQGALAAPQGPLHIKTLADKASIPVTTSLQGLGAFDEDDPMALHMLGLHGAGYANLAVQHADLIIALGARFDDRVTGDITKFAPAAQQAARQARGGVVHFDISPKNINKVVQATVSVVGDCAVNLERLLPYVKETQRPSWLAQIQAWKDKYPFSAYSRGSDAGNKGIPPQRVIERLSELVAPIKDRTIITTGVGQHQMWAAQHFRWKHPRTMITSGGLGTMGFGLPAAIGAKVARPDALVIDIDGDASFNMTLNELQTASQYGIGVKVLVLNNEEQGMVTHLQRVYYQNRFSHSYNLNPDFVRTARAMGVQARRCLELGELDGMLEWLLDSNGPALLEVRAAPGALSLPMVPSGKGLDEFLFYDDICAF